jgi:diguanylate cyclase (GGDEF)-like protein/putative nucleotidyltransferase with HDIG domain
VGLLPETQDYSNSSLFPWRCYLLIALVVTGVLGATMLGVVEVRRWQDRQAAADLAAKAEGAAASLAAGLQKPLAILGPTAQWWEGAEKADGPSFAAMAKSLQPQAAGVEALAWVPRVADADRAGFESAARAEGLRQFRISDRTGGDEPLPAPRREDYYPIRFLAPVQGHEATLGLDLGLDAAVRKAIEQAVDTGQPAATGRTSLFTPNDTRQRLLIFQAVYRRGAARDSAEHRAAGLAGFIVAVVRVADLAEAAAAPLKGKDLVMRLYDEAMPAGQRFLCQVITSGPQAAVQVTEQQAMAGRSSPRYLGGFTLAGRQWRVVCTPGFGWTAGPTWTCWAVALGGCFVAGLLIACFILGTGRGGTVAKQLRSVQHRLEEAANTDALTGVNARRRILDLLKTDLDCARHQNSEVTVALFHLDHLREVNGTLGQAIGDRVMVEVAKLLQVRLRQKDRIGRHGDNEFLVIMPETTAAEAAALAEEIRKVLAQRHIASASPPLPITVSIGIATASPNGAETVDSIMREADRALEVAKGGGGNCTRTSGDAPPPCRSLIGQNPDVQALGLTLARLAAQAKEGFIDSLRNTIEAIDARDPGARHHAVNTTRYAVEIARALGLGEEQVGLVRRAAMLHDIGNIAVPDAILQKTGLLTSEERRLVEQHVTIGVGLLRPMRFLDKEASIIRQHHERWDGRGYPDGIRDEVIPIEARIIAVADAFDAITSDRSYRKARDASDAIEILLGESHRQFDPDVVDALVCWVRATEAGESVPAGTSAEAGPPHVAN